MQRHGQIIKLKPGVLESYTKYHSEVWPGVLATIRDCNIQNYSIFHKDGFLFTYFEYVGNDFEKDMQKMADDPLTREWWKIMGPMQEPLKTRKEGEWWAEMDEVFHLE